MKLNWQLIAQLTLLIDKVIGHYGY